MIRLRSWFVKCGTVSDDSDVEGGFVESETVLMMEVERRGDPTWSYISDSQRGSASATTGEEI
jgi:hypothetical protein